MFPASFSAAALPWQNFYILVGTAAATLVGLMFVAVTFGASLVTEETLPTARSFLDPTFTHFVQILLMACLVLMPVCDFTLLGVILVVLGALRLVALLRTYKNMSDAHRRSGDIELSDWLSSIVFPAMCHSLLVAAGVAFVRHVSIAFNLLAFVAIALLMLGVFGAWELLVWMALMRVRRENGSARREPVADAQNRDDAPRP